MIHLLKDYVPGSTTVFDVQMMFQDVMEHDDSVTDVIHPLVDDVRAGGTIQSVSQLEGIMDDGYPCFSILIATETEEYVVGMLWVADVAGFIELGSAIGSQQKSLDWVNSWVPAR